MANKVELKKVQRIFYTTLGLIALALVIVTMAMWHGIALVASVLAIIGAVCGVIWGPEIITKTWNKHVDRVNRHES